MLALNSTYFTDADCNVSLCIEQCLTLIKRYYPYVVKNIVLDYKDRDVFKDELDIENQIIETAKYMALVKVYKTYKEDSKLSLVPNKQIDSIWHTLILNTKEYSNFCNGYFGEMYHHYAMFGKKGTDIDDVTYKQAVNNTKKLWEQHYNESIYVTSEAQKCPQKCPG